MTEHGTKPQPPNENRRDPNRMGGVFTVLLFLMMVLLILRVFNPDEQQEGRNFRALFELAYRGDVQDIRPNGKRAIDAEVFVDGKTEQWDNIPVPEYATDELVRLEELATRDVGRKDFADLVRELDEGAIEVVGGYTLNNPHENETGLYVQYRVGAQTLWARVMGDASAARITDLIRTLKDQGVTIEPRGEGHPSKFEYQPSSDVWSGVLLTFLPWVAIMALFLWFLSRQMRAAGGSGGIMSFGRSRVKMLTPDQAKVTFDQVAGIEEAKEEVQEIIQFLRDPKSFSRLGGRVPRGVLLVGPPGTGKTLLAKAIAGEANVPFFAISGSDFVEMFVGVGASRVRDLFKQARENAPCVIFLDEIDAVGRKRGAGLGGGHDEREQTLNAILVEMDGFSTDTGVIVIAATNRPDVLDAALLRPGRFDRQIALDLPDVKGREAILVVHAQAVKLSPSVDLSLVARGTPMFSGAELEALINEAALIATMKKKDAIEQDDLEEARDKVRFGRQKKSRVMVEEDRRITAFHESGHAIIAHLLPEVEPLHKVTIIPRGMALGATMQLPERDKYHHRKKELLGTLALLYGGRVSEEIFCDDISGGAANDIERATDIARNMVCLWGMSEKLGPMTLGEHRQEVFLGDELVRNRNYSEATSQAIDEEVRRLLEESYRRAKSIVEKHREDVERIATGLLRFETLSADEVQRLLSGTPLDELRPESNEPPPPAPERRSPVVRPEPDEDGEKGFGGLPVPDPA